MNYIELVNFLSFLEQKNLDYNFFFFKLIFLLLQSSNFTNLNKNYIYLFMNIFVTFDHYKYNLNDIHFLLRLKTSYLKKNLIFIKQNASSFYSLFFFSFNELNDVQKHLRLRANASNHLNIFSTFKKFIFSNKFYLSEIKFLFFFFLKKFLLFISSTYTSLH